MRQTISRWLWTHRPDLALRKQGLPNHTLVEERDFLRLMVEIAHQRRALVTLREMHNLYSLVTRCVTVAGDLAEVGVYRGGSARILCESKGDRTLHLFDTFAGLPEADPDVDLHHQGEFADTSLHDVRAYLSRYSDLQFHPGRFPETASGLPEDARFSFVHLDVDLYESTRDGLEYFYPRTNRRGMIVVHDYRSKSCPGVRRAVDEFFACHPEPVVELWDTQCLIVKE